MYNHYGLRKYLKKVLNYLDFKESLSKIWTKTRKLFSNEDIQNYIDMIRYKSIFYSSNKKVMNLGSAFNYAIDNMHS